MSNQKMQPLHTRELEPEKVNSGLVRRIKSDPEKVDSGPVKRIKSEPEKVDSGPVRRIKSDPEKTGPEPPPEPEPEPVQAIRVITKDEEHFHGAGSLRFAKNLIKAFKPIRYLLIAVGRWPLTQVPNSFGAYTYTFRWTHPRAIYFIITSILYWLLLLGAMYNLIVILLRVSNPIDYFEVTRKNGVYKRINRTIEDADYMEMNSLKARNISVPDSLSKSTKKIKGNASRLHVSLFREGIVIQRNFALIVSVLASLIFMSMASSNILKRHRYIANYFTFWSRAINTMKMDLSKGTSTTVWVYVIMVILGTFILTVMAVFQLSASVSGIPVVIGIFIFKIFHPNMMTETPLDTEFKGDVLYFTVYRIVGGICFLYIFLGAKAYILLFLFKCKLLKNGFASWNGRAYAAILRRDKFTQTKEGRTTFRHLFVDHCILLDLLEGTSRLYSGALETYFVFQVGALCFEFYLVLRCAKFGHNIRAAETGGYFIRPFDYIPPLIFFITNLSIFIAVLNSATDLADEAISGLEIIRRKTMLGRKTDAELYFMLSMYTSYTSHNRLQLTAGGHLNLNKGFVVTLIAAIFTYFVLLYQFQPQFDLAPRVDGQRYIIGEFLVFLENGVNCSWRANLTC